MRTPAFLVAMVIPTVLLAQRPSVLPDTAPASQRVLPLAPVAGDAFRREALTRYALGRTFARSEHVKAAEKQFQAATAKDPKALAPKRELARLYAQVGREAAAIRLAKEVVAEDNTDRDTAKLLGTLLMDARKPDEAKIAFQLAVKASQALEPWDRLLLVKQWIRAAELAKDGKGCEAARLESLNILATHREALLKSGLFTPVELERERARHFEGIGDALVQRSQFKQAAAAYDTARELFADTAKANDPAGALRIHWNRAGILQVQGDAAGALQELERYLAAKPSGFAPYQRFVELQSVLKSKERLPTLLEELAAQNPKNAAPRFLRADALMTTEPEDADTAFRTLLATLKSADEANVVVTAYQSQARGKPLLDHLDRLYKAARPRGFDDHDRDPNKEFDDASTEAVERARLLTAAMKTCTATYTKLLLDELQRDATNGVVRHVDTYELLLGQAERCGSVDRLAPILIQAVATNVKDVRLKFLAVRALAHEREWGELAEVADRLSQSDRNRFYPGIKAQAALAFAELNKPEPALAILQELGDTPYMQGFRIRVYNILGRPAEALKVCEAVLASERLTDDQLLSTQRLHAETLNLLGRHADAERVLRNLIDDHPDDALLLNFLGYQLAEQNRKLEEAEQLVRRAMTLDRDERRRTGEPEREAGGYLDSLGWVQFRRGDFVAARKSLELACASPESAADALVWDHLGDVCYRLKDKEAAEKAWKQAEKHYRSTHQGRQFGRADELQVKLKLVK